MRVASWDMVILSQVAVPEIVRTSLPVSMISDSEAEENEGRYDAIEMRIIVVIMYILILGFKD
jgi:hypothetical protein